MSALLLLADSQLLFRPAQLPQLVQRFPKPRVFSAAYIGAANGNQTAFFELACSALETLFGKPVPCHFIRTPDEHPSQACDLVILAGGSVTAGWEFLQQAKVRAWLDACRQADAVFIGVSAGAIHLASGCDPELLPSQPQTYLGWAPLFVSVHEENEGWPSRQYWQAAMGMPDFRNLSFAGIPMGAGLWIEGDTEKGLCNSVGKPGLQWNSRNGFPLPEQPHQQQ